MKILVADDSKTTLAILTNALENIGHQVIPVLSGKMAIQAFQDSKPDLIILDVVMDEIDGFECAKKIRAINSDDWIPIIFLSATVDDESIAKGIDAGGDDYLTKPFSKITLAAKIKAMQRIADMRNKLYETTVQLYLQSSTDALTGIYNRFQFDRSINEIIAMADRYNHAVALLFIDVDHFKNINDSFGHKVGDLLLKEVASRLKSCLNANDFLARIGGDEFAIILSEIKNIDAAGVVAKNILHVLGKKFELDSNIIRIGVSIGIAAYEAPGMSASVLLQNADISMYHAKHLGRNNYQYFSDKLYLKYKRQINLEHGIKFALERNELSLMYQPIFDLNSKKMIGCETLLRWQHPTFGIISPGVFIPIAEEQGVMQGIGDWVVTEAINQYRVWNAYNMNDFKLSINLSYRQLTEKNLVNFIKNKLESTGVSPENIEFELMESSIMTHSEKTIKDALAELQQLGLKIAIDDFGTGYSSLIRLKHLPINTLKIDKTFIQDVFSNQNSNIIVRCMIALGRNLNLAVVAKGIETEEQLTFLLKYGCTQGQGNFLSKPLVKDEIEKALSKANSHSS